MKQLSKAKQNTCIANITAALNEADVKQNFLRLFGLDLIGNIEYGRIDYASENLWIEFKRDVNLASNVTRARIVGQMLHYLHNARKSVSSELTSLPAFFAVADANETLIFNTIDFEQYVTNDQYFRGLSPCQQKEQLENALLSDPKINDVKVFHTTNDSAVLFERFEAIVNNKQGVRLRKIITAENFVDVFEHWEAKIGTHVKYHYDNVIKQQCNLEQIFLQDISDNYEVAGKYLMIGNFGAEIDMTEYQYFWETYYRPVDDSVQIEITNKLDRLKDDELRQRKGQFYTPVLYANKGIDYIVDALGLESRDELSEYYIWDMCAGTGNLELNLPSACYEKLFMSTLDQEEVDAIEAQNYFPNATVFQYDYLNDDIDKVLLDNTPIEGDLFGSFYAHIADRYIDDSLNWKLPRSLREVISKVQRGEVKMIVLINPPYAEATNSSRDEGAQKGGTAMSIIKDAMKNDGMGKASNELFLQFLYRIEKEVPQSMLGMFSSLKYIQASGCEKWREQFTGEYKNGFLMHAQLFSGTKGNWPIAFATWQL